MPAFITLTANNANNPVRFDAEALTAIRYFPAGRSAGTIEFFDGNGPCLQAEAADWGLDPHHIAATLNAAGFPMVAMPLRYDDNGPQEFPVWVSPAAVTYVAAGLPYGLNQSMDVRLGVEGFYDSDMQGTTPGELAALHSALLHHRPGMVSVDPALTVTAYGGASSLLLFDPAAIWKIKEDRMHEVQVNFRNSAFLTLPPAPGNINLLKPVFTAQAQGLIALPDAEPSVHFRPSDIARYKPGANDSIYFVHKREKNAPHAHDFHVLFNSTAARDQALDLLDKTFSPGNIWPARRFAV